MEQIILEKPVQLFVVRAEKFPEGVLKAHQALHSIIPFQRERRYFGLSRPEGSQIQYWAAAEVLPTDHTHSELERMKLESGDYTGKQIAGFRNQIEAIGQTFQELIRLPEIDPGGYCVEWYHEEDVTCMVRVIT